MGIDDGTDGGGSNDGVDGVPPPLGGPEGPRPRRGNGGSPPCPGWPKQSGDAQVHLSEISPLFPVVLSLLIPSDQPGKPEGHLGKHQEDTQSDELEDYKGDDASVNMAGRHLGRSDPFQKKE